MINGYWIYWKEQCQYCKNRINCEYIEKINNYINNLSQVDDKGCYGSLSFKCDYFIFDKELYNEKNPGECCG